jgi:glycosyltransferase involved in cell wall biosynthesis
VRAGAARGGTCSSTKAVRFAAGRSQNGVMKPVLTISIKAIKLELKLTNQILSNRIKIAIIYLDKRADFLIKGFNNNIDIVRIDCSNIKIPLIIKLLSLLISFHFDKRSWNNDFHRCPIITKYKGRIVNNKLNKILNEIDAILLFGCMIPIKNSLITQKLFFIYTDGVYNLTNKNWIAPRFGNYFFKMQKNMFLNTIKAFTFSNWAKYQLCEQYGLFEENIIQCGWGPCVKLPDNDCNVIKKGKAKQLLFIGNDAWVKGVDILINAFNKLSINFPDLKLDIAGKLKCNFKNINRDKINILGFCNQEKIIDLFMKSDIFILPSRFERSAHVTVEAMFYGLPVIVTNTYGSPEPILAGKCGFVVNPNDVDSIVNAVDTLVKNEKLFNTMSINAVKEANTHWKWESVCSTIFNNIQTILE